MGVKFGTGLSSELSNRSVTVKMLTPSAVPASFVTKVELAKSETCAGVKVAELPRLLDPFPGLQAAKSVAQNKAEVSRKKNPNIKGFFGVFASFLEGFLACPWRI